MEFIKIMPIPQFLSGYDFNNLQVCGLTHLDLGHVHFSERDTLRHLLSRCRSLQVCIIRRKINHFQNLNLT
jgi:hypothetical protein